MLIQAEKTRVKLEDGEASVSVKAEGVRGSASSSFVAKKEEEEEIIGAEDSEMVGAEVATVGIKKEEAGDSEDAEVDEAVRDPYGGKAPKRRKRCQLAKPVV